MFARVRSVRVRPVPTHFTHSGYPVVPLLLGRVQDHRRLLQRLHHLKRKVQQTEKNLERNVEFGKGERISSIGPRRRLVHLQGIFDRRLFLSATC